MNKGEVSFVTLKNPALKSVINFLIFLKRIRFFKKKTKHFLSEGLITDFFKIIYMNYFATFLITSVFKR